MPRRLEFEPGVWIRRVSTARARLPAEPSMHTAYPAPLGKNRRPGGDRGRSMKPVVAVLLAGCLALAGSFAASAAPSQNAPKVAPGKGGDPGKKEEKLVPMTFRLVTNGQDCADCTWIAADGDIVYETGRTF